MVAVVVCVGGCCVLGRVSVRSGGFGGYWAGARQPIANFLFISNNKRTVLALSIALVFVVCRAG